MFSKIAKLFRNAQNDNGQAHLQTNPPANASRKEANLEWKSLDITRLNITGNQLQNIEASMGTRARQKGLKLITEIAPDAPKKVKTDLARLTQIITNLVGNSLKFTTEGEVKVRVIKHDDAHWGVTVSDTGPGIATEDQARIFEEFQQTELGAKARDGTGLGLALSKRLIELQGGRIWVDSELGKGSRFTFAIPAKVS